MATVEIHMKAGKNHPDSLLNVISESARDAILLYFQPVLLVRKIFSVRGIFKFFVFHDILWVRLWVRLIVYSIVLMTIIPTVLMTILPMPSFGRVVIPPKSMDDAFSDSLFSLAMARVGSDHPFLIAIGVIVMVESGFYLLSRLSQRKKQE